MPRTRKQLKMTAVFVDLDSTLCNTQHRAHLIDREKGTDWVAYSMACSDDEPMEATVVLVRMLASDHRIVILSGRDEKAAVKTAEWLQKHDIPHDGILLRRKGDRGSNGEYKANRIKEWRRLHPGVRAVLMLDDWPPVKPAVEQLGIPTLILNPILHGEDQQGDLADGMPMTSGQRLA